MSPINRPQHSTSETPLNPTKVQYTKGRGGFIFGWQGNCQGQRGSSNFNRLHWVLGSVKEFTQELQEGQLDYGFKARGVAIREGWFLWTVSDSSVSDSSDSLSLSLFYLSRDSLYFLRMRLTALSLLTKDEVREPSCKSEERWLFSWPAIWAAVHSAHILRKITRFCPYSEIMPTCSSPWNKQRKITGLVH